MKTTKPKTANAIRSRAKRYTLNDALHYMQENHIIIMKTSQGFELWCNGIDIPNNVKTVLYRKFDEITEMMMRSDIRTCPSPGLHQPWWHCLEERDYRCAICDQLQIA